MRSPFCAQGAGRVAAGFPPPAAAETAGGARDPRPAVSAMGGRHG